MDDNTAQLSHQNGQFGGGVNNASQLGGSNSGSMNKPGDGNPSTGATSHEQIYSIPGVLHFIQHEFSRFEIERSQWEVDRAELQVRHVHSYSLKHILT